MKILNLAMSPKTKSKELKLEDSIIQSKKSFSIKHVPLTRGLEHTMYDALDNYVFQKLPKDTLINVISKGIPVEVHGLFPEFFEANCKKLGLEIVNRVNFKKGKIEKALNFLRPRFYECKKTNGKKVFIAAISPGLDYLTHFAAIIRHSVAFYSYRHLEKLGFYKYHHAERTIDQQTGLLDLGFSFEGTLIMGHVDKLRKSFEMDAQFQLIDSSENYYYRLSKFKKGRKIITLFGVKYSFWGNTAADLVGKVLNAKVNEVIYFAKLGCLDSPQNIYNKIYSPSEFYIFNHNMIVKDLFDVKNDFLKCNPQFDSGTHLSVPTVLEEDYLMREVASKNQINSIDNEISQIASRVKSYDGDVSFTALHYATDYIRTKKERNIELEFDLSTNRSKSAIQKKRQIQRKIINILTSYLKGEKAYA